MRISVNPHDRTPIYVQLVNAVKELINGGQLPVGHRLPSVRQLGRDLRVNLNTVARAYRELSRLGLVSVRQGHGAVIASSRCADDARQRERLRRLAAQLVSEAMLLGLEASQLHALVDSELAGTDRKRRIA